MIILSIELRLYSSTKIKNYMDQIIIKNCSIINEGKIIEGDVLVKNSRIDKVGGIIDEANAREINGEGKHLIPGIIDDQVHFREPGLTHKANIATESRAALAGGVTTFMEMPNTKPAALTQELLQDKYDIAKQTAFTNYSFFMGASNDNLEEALKTDRNKICGVKIFMGSSTGNMLVDDRDVLDKLFGNLDILIATHCEDEETIRANHASYVERFGNDLDATYHPIIRSREGCLLSSSLAVELAKKHNTRLHILHISTKDEIDLFDNSIPLKDKRITSEACVHHMFFKDEDYHSLGNKIKCNPAIKAEADRKAIFDAVFDDRIDIIATDHAPHTVEEKSRHYLEAPSGLPLVQHALNIMLDFYHKGEVNLEEIVRKMCHTPTECFELSERGYIREGYYADLALVDIHKTWEVSKDNILYKCGWSPLEGYQLKGKVEKTLINGMLAFDGESLIPGYGMRVLFDR